MKLSPLTTVTSFNGALLLFTAFLFGSIIMNSYANIESTVSNLFLFNPSGEISTSKTIIYKNEVVTIRFSATNKTAPYTFHYTINGDRKTIVSDALGVAKTTTKKTSEGVYNYVLTKVVDKDGKSENITNQKINITVKSLIDVDFTFDNNTCSGEVIQFNAVLENPDELTYQWDFNHGITSEQLNPSHEFTNIGCTNKIYPVKLLVKDKDGNAFSITKEVTVLPKPDIAFRDQKTRSSNFSNCYSPAADNANFEVIVENISNSTCVASFFIDWGDGTTSNSASFPAEHTYTSIGNFILKIIGTGTNGCKNEVSYDVTNASNPAGGFESPGSTSNLCLPTAELNVGITNWGLNSLDTSYIVNFGDGVRETYTQAELQASSYYNSVEPENSEKFPTPHSYSMGSCAEINNEFVATLTVQNSCGSTNFTIDNILVLEPPEAEFEAVDFSCVNTPITFLNKSILGDELGCSKNADVTWDFGDGTVEKIFSSETVDTIDHFYTEAGTYNVSLTIESKCGITVFTKQICIEPNITPSFLVDNAAGCIPLIANTTNTTDESQLCSLPSYKWEVVYEAENCGLTANWSFDTGSDENSENPSFIFSTSGKYTLKQTIITSCGETSTTKTINVKKPPTAVLNEIADSCGITTINPTAAISTCNTDGNTTVYEWSFPGGTPATSNLLNPGDILYNTPGTYEVTLEVTNECGISGKSVQTFQVFEKPRITNTNLTQEICSTQSSSAIELTSDNSSAQYSWSASASAGLSGFIANGTSNTIPSQAIINTGNTDGIVKYTAIPRTTECEGDPIEFTITVNPSPIFTTHPSSSEVCLNGTPTTLEVAFINGTGAPSYQWYSNTINNNTSGSKITGANKTTYTSPADTEGTLYYYAIISFPSGKCSQIASNTATVKIVSQLNINTVATSNTICVGGLVDTFKATYSGGTGTPLYQWFTNTTNTNTGGTIITGANNASFKPSNLNTVGDFYYYVEVSLDGNGCNNASSDVFHVKVVSDPIINEQPIALQELCQNVVPKKLTVTASVSTTTNVTYQWFSTTKNSNTGGVLISGASENSFTPFTSTVGTAYYYVVVSQRESGCSITSDVATIQVNEAPTFTKQPSSSEVCLNGAATLLEVDFINGIGTPNYQWFSNATDNNTGGTKIIDATNLSFSPPTDSEGIVYYYVVISFDSGECSEITSNTATVNVAPPLNFNSEATSQTVCIGGLVNAFEISLTGGAGTPSYQWYANTTNTNSGGSLISGATSVSFTPTTFNTVGDFYYYAKVSLAGSSCNNVSSDVYHVAAVLDPTINTQPIASQEVCQNVIPTNLTVAASGSTTSSLTYQWFKNIVNSNTGGNLISGATENVYTPPTSIVGTGYYYVVISQSESGCAVTSNIATLKVNGIPTFTTQPSSSEVCLNGEQATLQVTYTNGTGTPNYQWFSNVVNSNTNGTPISGANASTFSPPSDTLGTLYYYATISFNSGGCAMITSNAARILVNQTPIVNNNAITIYSGTTFDFDPSIITGNTVPQGTQYIWSTPVINPTDAIVGASAATIPQDNISQNLENIANASSKVTYLIIPIKGACSGDPFTLEVTVNAILKPNAVIENNSCFESNDGAINTSITGGVPFDTGAPYQTTWTGPNGYASSNPSISNLSAGMYELTIEDKNGYQFTKSYTVTQPNFLDITLDLEKNISCFEGTDGIIEVTVSGGTLPYIYNWSTANGNGIVPNEKNQNTLAAGTYTLQITDKNNCTTSKSFTLTAPQKLVIDQIIKEDILCFEEATGSIDLNISGGTKAETSSGVFDYFYSWSGPNGFVSNTKKANNLTPGNYTVVITDNLGCSTNTTVSIIQSSEIEITVTKSAVSCYGENDGSINIEVSGGVSPYEISWDHLANGFSINNLSAGNYTATITDTNNCAKQVTVSISQSIFYIDPIITPISCNGANDGAIDLVLNGGIAPFSVTWSDDASAGLQRNNLTPGSYTVTILDSDANQCPIEQTFIYTNPAPLAVSSTVLDASDCTVVNSGSIDLEISGGTKPYAFNWNTNATTEDLENLPPGDYFVEITDIRGCKTTAQFSIFRQDPIVINLNQNILADCNLQTINLQTEAKVTGGFLPYTFNWSAGTPSGVNSNTMNASQNGSYTLTITDGKGCTETKSFIVNLPELGSPNFNYSAFALTTYNQLSIQDPIEFTNLSTGEYTSIHWDFGDGSPSSTEENPVHTYDSVGNYNVVLKAYYSSGCIEKFERIVDITLGYALIHPTAFTPNGDGYNDMIRPSYRGFKTIKMTIYDSWGTIVYSEEGSILEGWNGMVNAKSSENGNYVMVVKGITFYDKEITKSSPITLLK